MSDKPDCVKNEEIAAILVIGAEVLESSIGCTVEQSTEWVDKTIDALQSEGLYEQKTDV